MPKGEDDKFKGEMSLDATQLQNVPAWLSVIQINFDGALLIVQGMTHRGGNSKEVIWVYKRIKG